MKPFWAAANPAVAMAVLLLAVTIVSPAWSAAVDEVVLKSGRKYMGTIVSDSADSLVLSIDGGTVRIPRDAVLSPPYFGPPAPAEVPVEATPPEEPTPVTGNPLPATGEALEWLQSFEWSEPLAQIPVQVTDRGRWPFLPALAFSAGNFFQLRLYGDPGNPAAIEVSLPQGTADTWEAKGQLLEYMLGLVPGLAVDDRFSTLNIRGDSFAVGDLWFAITDAASAETPGRWTVVLMHERSLTPARASLGELEAISEPVATAIIDPDQPRSWQEGSWTPEEIATIGSAETTPPPANAASSIDSTEAQVRQWLALNSSRVFVRAFARVRGRYVPTETEWLQEE